MRKPDSLRAAIEAAVPDLARNPGQLKIWLDKGSVQACGRGVPVALAYRYKLSLLVLDFAASEPHTLFAAIEALLGVDAVAAREVFHATLSDLHVSSSEWRRERIAHIERLLAE